MSLIQGDVAWQSPSNIAIVKYWGKYGRQFPRNASISFTLSTSVSKTKLHFEKKEDINKEIDIDFIFEGDSNKKFGEKTAKFFTNILDQMPFLGEYKFTIESKNTFPHSSGIASSASGMSALSLCILDMHSLIEHGHPMVLNEELKQKASYLSRLGSGSACRSIYSHIALWGEHPNIAGSSQEFAIPIINDVDAIFNTYHDDILIASRSEKSVSSTAGHGLMDGNVYAEVRYQQAQDKITQTMSALKNGDVHLFGNILEEEALTLHALMMCSNPSYILLEPTTLDMIKSIRTFRLDTGLPLYFSLDAGPNIHLLYPDNISHLVQPFIQGDLKKLCHDGTIIHDKVGEGPIRLY